MSGTCQRPAVSVPLPKEAKLILPADTTLEEFDIILSYIAQSVQLQVAHGILRDQPTLYNSSNPNVDEPYSRYQGGRGRGRGRGRCFQCGDVGHMAPSCPMRNNQQDFSGHNTSFIGDRKRPRTSLEESKFGSSFRLRDDSPERGACTPPPSPPSSSQIWRKTSRPQDEELLPNETKIKQTTSTEASEVANELSMDADGLYPRSLVKVEEQVIVLEDDDD